MPVLLTGRRGAAWHGSADLGGIEEQDGSTLRLASVKVIAWHRGGLESAMGR